MCYEGVVCIVVFMYIANNLIFFFHCKKVDNDTLNGDQHGAVLSTRHGGIYTNAFDIFTYNGHIYTQVLVPYKAYNYPTGITIPTNNWIHYIFTFSTTSGFFYFLFIVEVIWKATHPFDPFPSAYT